MPSPDRSPDQIVRVSTLELFFDLVFVFTITQLTAVLAEHPTGTGLGQVGLMLTVIWWMYGGYAWLTNAVSPDRALYRLVLLGGMAGFMVISVAIRGAFSGDGAVFALAYLLVVCIHAGLYSRSFATAFVSLARFNLPICALLIAGGFAEGDAQYVLWGAATAFIAWLLTGPARGEAFQINPSHFVERHGLVIIVALGESVVAVGIGASGQPLSAGLVAVILLGLALAACLWWVHFGEDDDERARGALERAPAARRPALALDAFYLWHLLMLLGVVALASALEFAIAHPGDPLAFGRALALSGGAALFLLGNVLFRRTLRFGALRWRLSAAGLALVAIPIGTEGSGIAQLGLVFALVGASLALEHRREPRPTSSYPSPHGLEADPEARASRAV
jgi:low temperature requirement protein LtrA